MKAVKGRRAGVPAAPRRVLYSAGVLSVTVCKCAFMSSTRLLLSSDLCSSFMVDYETRLCKKKGHFRKRLILENKIRHICIN